MPSISVNKDHIVLLFHNLVDHNVPAGDQLDKTEATSYKMLKMRSPATGQGRKGILTILFLFVQWKVVHSNTNVKEMFC